MGITLIDRAACPLCGCDVADDHMPFPEIPIKRCSACAFMFSSRLMPADDLKRYYAEDFGSVRHRRGQMVNAMVNTWVFGRVLGSSARAVRNLLDVGTGYGFFLNTAGAFSSQCDRYRAFSRVKQNTPKDTRSRRQEHCAFRSHRNWRRQLRSRNCF